MLVPVAPLSELITPKTSGAPVGALLADAAAVDAALDAAPLDVAAAGGVLDVDELLQAVMATASALTSASGMK